MCFHRSQVGKNNKFELYFLTVLKTVTGNNNTVAGNNSIVVGNNNTVTYLAFADLCVVDGEHFYLLLLLQAIFVHPHNRFASLTIATILLTQSLSICGSATATC